MGLLINTNVQALAAQRSLGLNYAAQNKSLERLSSGFRINRSGDDAAGLAISEKLKGHIRSMQQANRNANDGVSLVQVAEGGLSEIGNILIRIRELSIQGASDTIGDQERGFIDKEVQSLKSEIARISQVTEFNGRKLLDGSQPPLEIQVGIHNNPFEDRLIYDTSQIITTLNNLGVTQADIDRETQEGENPESVRGLNNLSAITKDSSRNNLERIDVAIYKINESRSALGALQNRLMSTINNMNIYRENLEAANSRIRDTDMATETSELVKNNILTSSGVAMLSQANNNTALALKLLG